MKKNIDEALDYIYSFINLENNLQKKYIDKEYSLDNVINILNYFDNPHKNKKIIHIAGTKGKGSTSIFTSYLLMQCGFNVATFVSPHLIKPNERILFNIIPIQDSEIIDLVNQLEPVLKKNNLTPTTFELFFLIFLLYAKKKNSDYLIIEVGLGGRLDTTNVVEPLISIITTISFDHTNILGNTIKKISNEKAGIIKENKITICGKQTYNCKSIFKKIAKEKKSKFFDITKCFKLLNFKANEAGIIFSFRFFDKKVDNLFLPIYGKHQIYNFAMSLLAVYLIDNNILQILDKDKKLDIKIAGRIELINQNFPIILDVSHNKDSCKKLKETLKLHFPTIKKWVILSGMTQDKDFEGFYSQIKSICDTLIITKPDDYKKSEPQKVFEIAKKYCKNTVFVEEFDKAMEYSISQKKPLLVTGSFYIAGPFLEYFEKNKV
ncbi:MAG: hypothetical protein A2086_07525 [Spirochaetes bacterium GWD1_27_9]|nr:MAG: hypothetical protein A2Y34_13360 [Spirochaetes bacterium GWC1_27_15]OHD44782.1 MAG: hypothetical protein A2086_07525 [Spirochaetes bacterium GWD1_27_9]